MAHASVKHETVPLLNNGIPFPLTTTLRELKQAVANGLGETITFPESPKRHECNCYLARSIARYGTWDMLRCRTHQGPNCDYAHETFDSCELCSLCQRHLNDPCETCETGETNESECALVVNAGCVHKFHHHC